MIGTLTAISLIEIDRTRTWTRRHPSAGRCAGRRASKLERRLTATSAAPPASAPPCSTATPGALWSRCTPRRRRLTGGSFLLILGTEVGARAVGVVRAATTRAPSRLCELSQ